MSARIKGVSPINTLAILREVLGGTRFHSVVAACPLETQQLIRRTLVAGEWISVELWAPFLQAIFEQVFRNDEAQFRRLLRAVSKRDFSTVYRQYVTQTSPMQVLDQAPNLWTSYFDSGSLQRAPQGGEAGESSGAENDPRIILQMRDLETSFPVYAVAMHAYLEQVLIMAGARQVVIERRNEQLRDGKLSCDYLVDLAPQTAT